MDSTTYSHEFDAAEVARSTLACLSQSDNNQVHEVHIGRMREIWSRFDHAPESVKFALKHLSFLREAEHLGHGYWLPAPTRTVPLTDGKSIVVSIAPTMELERHFPSVKRAGLGRVVETSQAHQISTQSIDSWLGRSILDARSWVDMLIDSATSELNASILSPDLEVFSVKTARSGAIQRRSTPTWVVPPDPRMITWRGLSLFRSKLGEKHHRYFLGEISENQRILEGPQVKDNLTLQYGLAAIIGRPLTTLLKKQSGSFQIDLPLIPPVSLKRLLLALCVDTPMRAKSSWLCLQPSCEALISGVVESLGSEIVIYE